jgi:hypothetical protein
LPFSDIESPGCYVTFSGTGEGSFLFSVEFDVFLDGQGSEKMFPRQCELYLSIPDSSDLLKFFDQTKWPCKVKQSINFGLICNGWYSGDFHQNRIPPNVYLECFLQENVRLPENLKGLFVGFTGRFLMHQLYSLSIV